MDLFQVKRSSGYGFEQIQITTLDDLQVETSPGGIVQDLRQIKFEHMEAALDDFQKNASKTASRAGWRTSPSVLESKFG